MPGLGLLASAAPTAGYAIKSAATMVDGQAIFTTAALLSANGPNLGMANPMFCPIGTLTMVSSVGSTTGTWEHHITTGRSVTARS